MLDESHSKAAVSAGKKGLKVGAISGAIGGAFFAAVALVATNGLAALAFGPIIATALVGAIFLGVAAEISEKRQVIGFEKGLEECKQQHSPAHSLEIQKQQEITSTPSNNKNHTASLLEDRAAEIMTLHSR